MRVIDARAGATSMDTAEIEVFLALAEEPHFGRTAERLRLPRPRVSRLVASLGRHPDRVLTWRGDLEQTAIRDQIKPALHKHNAARLLGL
jgi:Bacterial regulatory helix-turn-helix protein, lysR family